MKICLTVNSSPWSRFKGGGQIAVHCLAEALCRLGHEVHAIYSKCPGETVEPHASYKIHWARHYNFATLNLNIFSYAALIRRLARREKFDVVHCNAEEGFLFKRACPGIARVFTNHAPYIPSTGMLTGLLRPVQFLKTINPYLLRGTALDSAAVIAFSEFSKKLVVAALGPVWDGRTTTIAPGVDDSWFDCKRGSTKDCRILFWGRLEDEKGIPELLQAFKKIILSFPEARLTLVGEGAGRPTYRHSASEMGLLDRIEFAGWLPAKEVQKLAAESRIGVFPSRIESFGLAVAESMAAGLPVVACRAGAVSEIVEDGVTGRLVPVQNPDSLADAILETLRDPELAGQRADAARDMARQRYSWKHAAQKTAEVYDQASAWRL